ncbi:MAG: glycosyltransferase family 9 protein [Candidatus Neomarinimicrobiota bacterium]
MNNKKSFLVLRFSSIGDIILTTAVLRNLRQAYPAARIDFMTLTDFAPLLEGHPAIDRVIMVDRKAGFRILSRIGRRLRLDGYDYLIDLHNTLRAKIIRLHKGPVPALVFHKPRWKRFLLFRFYLNTFLPDFGIIRSLKAVVEPLTGPANSQPTELYVAPVERQAVRNLLTSRRGNGRYVCIAPGAAWRQKQWRPEYYSQVIARIVNKFKLDIVLLGSAKDIICDEIGARCPTAINLRGATTLRETLAIIAEADLIIGSDTGLTHAGEALGVSAIMILGPTSVETGAGPNRPDSVGIGLDLWCRPCSQSGSRRCYRREQFCMTGIGPEMVIQEVEKLITV